VTGAVRFTSVPLWNSSGCIRPPCVCLQKGSQQISSAPRFERASSSCLLSSSNSQHKGTAGLVSVWRQTPWRSPPVSWQSGRALVWDVTVVCPLADSYVASAAREARSIAELAATKKEDKYSDLAADYLFQPIAVESLSPINEINESASDFLSLLAKKISILATSGRLPFCSSAFPRARAAILIDWLIDWLSDL